MIVLKDEEEKEGDSPSTSSLYVLGRGRSLSSARPVVKQNFQSPKRALAARSLCVYRCVFDPSLCEIVTASMLDPPPKVHVAPAPLIASTLYACSSP
jgi:hypothetical protein